MQGKLKKNDIGRWEIVNELGDREELASGEVCELEIAGHWIKTRIESRSSSHAPYEAEYYACVPGVNLYQGMLARTK